LTGAGGADFYLFFSGRAAAEFSNSSSSAPNRGPTRQNPEVWAYIGRERTENNLEKDITFSFPFSASVCFNTLV